MDKIYVRGGIPLQGSIRVSGSKNASLPLMAACLLVDGVTTLHNVPDIRDIHTMAEMLQEVGAEVRFSTDGVVKIDATGFCRTSAPEELVRKMRASFYVLGPMLARLGHARVAQPGGCDIGARPVDFHIKGLRALGADVRNDGGIVEASAEKLVGARIYLDFPSAGATTHLMTAACMAEGVTIIENAATEPEVVDLAHFLCSLGGQVTGAGTSTVIIEGVKQLRAGAEYSVIPDRMEAGTYACAAAITRGDLILENVVPAHLQPVLVKLRDMGVTLEQLDEDENAPGRLRVSMKGRCRAVDILAMPHPGFPTDMQQPMVALLSVSEGAAMVTDRVFENRFRYVSELQRMGADVRVEGRTAFVHGVPQLTGAVVTSTDLRAGAAMIVAALAAEGESTIGGVEHVDRGYDALVEKLQSVGAEITRTAAERDLALPTLAAPAGKPDATVV
ncbi:MAG: UDP-N-acetylglucosamine 1-carboxyvinyltransferase [Armatimonadota bacterium]